MNSIIAIIITFFLIGIGLLGVVVPFLPGVPIAWLGLFIYALATDFTTLSLTTVLVFLGLTVLTFAFDIVLPLLGAKRYHATRFGLIGASLGLLLGLITLGPLGVLLGPFIGAFVGELLAGRQSDSALRAAFGAFLGFLVSSFLKIALVLVMAGFFIAALLR